MSNAGQAELARKRGAKKYETGLLSFMPWVIFTSTLCFCSLAQDLGILAWTFVIACIIVSAALVAIGCIKGDAIPIALGMLCIVAIVVALPVAQLVRADNTSEYWRLGDGATYYNVHPDEPGNMHADAVRLKFLEGSRIDTGRSASFMHNGDAYCVAPVVGPTAKSQRSPATWIAGMNCCSQWSSFVCASNDERSNQSLLNAISVDDTSGYYGKAAKMAMSYYDFPFSEADPFFISVVSDVDDYRAGLWNNALAVSGAASLLYFISSFIAGVLLAKMLPSKRVPSSPPPSPPRA